LFLRENILSSSSDEIIWKVQKTTAN